MWAIGFGPTNPPMPAGTAVTGRPAVIASLTVSVGGAPVNVLYAKLSPDATGIPDYYPASAIGIHRHRSPPGMGGTRHFPCRCADLRNATMMRLALASLLVHVFKVRVAVQAFFVEAQQCAAFLVGQARLAQRGFHVPPQAADQ